MANPLGQLLTDVRTLVSRLHDRDKLTDELLKQAHTLNDKIKCMKEYQDASNYTSLRNSANPSMSLSQLIANNLQQENRQIKLLQGENLQLKMALREHQAALDIIMTNYRQRMVHTLQLNKLEHLAESMSQLNRRDETSRDKFCEMWDLARLVDDCLKTGQRDAHDDQRSLAQLRSENATLKQLLKLAAQNDQTALTEFLELARDVRTFGDYRFNNPPGEDGGDSSKSSSGDEQHTPTRESVNLNGLSVDSIENEKLE